MTEKDDNTVEVADFSAADFVGIKSITHPARMSVMPVVAIKDEKIRILGTCFAISNQGLVMTALHVIEDAINLREQSKGAPSNDWRIGAFYIAEGRPEYNVPDLFGGFIQASNIYAAPEIDIGLMRLNLPVHQDSKASIPLPAFRLSPGLPHEGDTCFTLGYHNNKVEVKSENRHEKSISLNFFASIGIIEQLHFPRRDSVKLTWPCFQTSLRHEPTMSGAPIVSIDGAVIGIVCSAFDGTDIYYGSLIGPSLFLQIHELRDNGTTGAAFLYDFVMGGAVAVDKSLEQLKVNRSDNMLEINFGMPPIFIGKITT